MASTRNRQKRNPAVIKAAKRRDGFICQCCGILGEEGHHIHPLVYGGKDEVDNVITLCSLCHKGAPDNPDQFLQYQKGWGAFNAQYQTILAEEEKEIIRRAAVANEEIPSNEDVHREATLAVNLTRQKVYATTEACRLKGHDIFKKNWLDRSREENDRRILLAKEQAGIYIDFFKQFQESDFALQKTFQLQNTLHGIDELRETYGITKETREQQEMNQTTLGSKYRGDEYEKQCWTLGRAIEYFKELIDEERSQLRLFREARKTYDLKGDDIKRAIEDLYEKDYFAEDDFKVEDNPRRIVTTKKGKKKGYLEDQWGERITLYIPVAASIGLIDHYSRKITCIAETIRDLGGVPELIPEIPRSALKINLERESKSTELARRFGDWCKRELNIKAEEEQKKEVQLALTFA